MSSSSRSSSEVAGDVAVPDSVLAAYQIEPGELAPERGGLINVTFRVAARDREPRAVLQRLHPIFSGEVNCDIDALTAHLAGAGLETPRPLRTRDGALWVEAGDAVWRALSWIPGHTIHALESAQQAEVAGELVGRFHRALAPLSEYRFRFTRFAVHDTDAHLARLEEARRGDADFDLADEARALADEILAAAADRPRWQTLPARITHGDLKISNVRFAALDPAEARCLIDLDTLGRLTLPYELGDAMRSWCNTATEDEAPRFDTDVFAAAMRGYRRGAGDGCAPEELEAVPAGTQTVCLELAARFCVDAFVDEYFAWDPARYDSRRAHNLTRARSQLALARAVAERRRELDVIIHHDLGR